NAEPVEMHLPGRRISKMGWPCCRQTGDHNPRQAAAAHVGERRFVQHVIKMPSPQQVEEVQSALRDPCAEPGEAIVADLRAEAVDRLVARAGVVGGYPGCA